MLYIILEKDFHTEEVSVHSVYNDHDAAYSAMDALIDEGIHGYKMDMTITYQVNVDSFGTKRWRLNGKLHREDGPAIEWSDGSKEWYLNGKLHREDGPAIVHANGYQAWYLNGERHRENGPAVVCADGYQAWYLNDEELTEEGFNAVQNNCNGKVVEIDGIRYRLEKV